MAALHRHLKGRHPASRQRRGDLLRNWNKSWRRNIGSSWMRSTEKYRSYKGCWKRRRKDTREQQKNLKTSGENWTMNNRSFYNSRSMSKIKGLNFDRYLDTLFILMENNCAELQIIFGFIIEVPLTSSSFIHTNQKIVRHSLRVRFRSSASNW